MKTKIESEILFLLYLYAIEKNMLDKAIKYLEISITLMPSSCTLLRELAALYEIDNRYNSSVVYYYLAYRNYSVEDNIDFTLLKSISEPYNLFINYRKIMDCCHNLFDTDGISLLVDNPYFMSICGDYNYLIANQHCYECTSANINRATEYYQKALKFGENNQKILNNIELCEKTKEKLLELSYKYDEMIAEDEEYFRNNSY